MNRRHLLSLSLLASFGLSGLADPAPAPNPIDQLLIKACEEGNDNQVAVFLAEGASISGVDGEGFTPLMKAAGGAHPAVVKKLLGLKVAVDTTDKYGETALNIACWSGDLDSINQLLDAGANPNTQSKNGATPLMGAAYRGDVNMIGALLDKRAGIDARTLKGTALALAAQGDRMDAIKLLLDRGANPNVYGLPQPEDSIMLTPLTYAAEHGNEAAVNLLLDHGAKADDSQGGFTPMMDAARGNYVAIMETLKAHGATIDGQDDEHGNSALILAASWNQPKALRKLIEWKANLNLVDREGKTALVNALQYSAKDAVTLLIAQGADVNIKDKQGEVALGYAQNRGLVDVIGALKSHGATPVDLHMIPFSMPNHPVPPPHLWALALAEPYLQHDGENPHELLGHGDATDGAIRMLKDSWGITDHDSLLAELHQLATEGHRNGFQKAGERFTQMTDADFEKEMDAHGSTPDKVEQARAIRASYQKWKDRSGLAFDLVRYANLVDNGFCAHYLGEEESWNLLLPMAKKAQESFASWQELGDNFLDGRAMWNDGQRDDGYAELVQLLANPKDPASPWSIAWNTDLGIKVDTDTSLSQ